MAYNADIKLEYMREQCKIMSEYIVKITLENKRLRDELKKARNNEPIKS